MNYLKTYNRAFKKSGYNKHTNREPRYLFAIKNILKSTRRSIIDIGSGRGILFKILHEITPESKFHSVDLKNYHNLKYVGHITADISKVTDMDKIEGNYDILTCLDCLEHIEEDRIDDILKKFSSLSSEFLFSIANHSDVFDGVELHLTQRNSNWWSNKLSKYFNITYFESLLDDTLYLYKCKKRKIKYSFLVPYYKRDTQLFNTLNSFATLYKYRNDYEIIIIEDSKNSSIDRLYLDICLNAFKSLSIKRIPGTRSASFSPASNYNIGANEAEGEFFILTNPETMHRTDVLHGLDSEFGISVNSYIVCSCLSVDKKSLSMSSINTIEGKWYQHSVYRNVGCHFCSAISRENYFKIAGFSEEFSSGVGYDDDDFRNKVQEFGLNLINRDDLVTVHLFHEQASIDMDLFHKNHKLYHDKWGQNSFSAGRIPVV